MRDPPSLRFSFRLARYPTGTIAIRVLVGAAAAVATLLVIRVRPFRVEVAGASMEPTLLPGDYLLATARGTIRRGHLVVVDRTDQRGFELVKRVAGIPGDVIDGGVLDPGQYWVLGELSARSTDSRTFGAVARTAIKGIARLRYWPPSRVKWLGPAMNGSGARRFNPPSPLRSASPLMPST
jgi:signal peptidase I